jgi:glutathione S-transferase
MLAQMTTPPLRLVSFDLCPYVQRVAIALEEKGAAYDWVGVDLANKPDWFVKLSPTGKVPLLDVGGHAIFESSVILEYLEETVAPKLHPDDALRRADHRAWVEFASAVLTDIWGFYKAKDQSVYDAKIARFTERMARVEVRLSETGPYFDGEQFSLVDAAFAPALRYFDLFERWLDLKPLADLTRVARWRAAVAERPSVRKLAPPHYIARLRDFLKAQGGVLSAKLG